MLNCGSGETQFHSTVNVFMESMTIKNYLTRKRDVNTHQSSTIHRAVLTPQLCYQPAWPIGSSASGISTDSSPAVKLALINKVKQIQLLSIKINTHMQQYAHKPQHISTLQNQGDKASGFVLILTCEYNLKIYDQR